MKISLFFLTVLYSACLVAMHHDEKNSSRFMAIRQHDHKNLSISRSPGDWHTSEQSILAERPIQAARVSHAVIEHQEAAKKSHAVHSLAFISDQSLQLLDAQRKLLEVSMGSPKIDRPLQEMVEGLNDDSSDQEDTEKNWPTGRADELITAALSKPELKKELYELIIKQALLLNALIRFSESK